MPWTVDNWAEAESLIREATMKGAEQFAYLIKNDADERCPIDTGNMRDTGQIQADDEEVIIAYGPTVGKGGEDYTVRQHEDASLFHDNGKEDHWLENAGNAHTYGDAAELKDIIMGLLGEL